MTGKGKAGPVTAGNMGGTAFRQVMGLFATGVTVLAVDTPSGIHGMTANAISSVSLDPMLVLACIDRRAHMQELLGGARPFSINILRQEQESLSRFFAGAWPYPAPPEFRFQPGEDGPLLVGALASIGCRPEQVVDAGDHTVVIARVTSLHPGESGAPLLFFAGRYRRLMEATAYAGAPADPWTHEAARIFHD